MIRRLLDWLERQPRWLAWVLVVVSVAGLGLLDFATGSEVAFSFFYLAPVAMAAWRLGRRGGWAISTASAATWLVANAISGQQVSGWWIDAWNALTRAGFFLVVTGLLSTVRDLLESERLLARTDDLTGLASRRAFLDRCEVEVARAKRTRRPLSLLFLDLDGFKAINDRFGHAEGDEVLRAAATAIRRATRGEDLCGRLGGDELAVLLPDADPDVARSVVERLRVALRGGLAGREGSVTCSVGAVTCTVAPASVEAMLGEADALLYAAKQAGGDRAAFRSAP